MKKSLLTMTALAAMLFAGCSSSDELTTLESIKQAENAPTPVSFGTYMGKQATTRTVTTQDYVKGPIANTAVDADGVKSLAQAGFGVFSYFTQASDYDPANVGTAPSNIAPNFMYNQKLEYDDSKSWIYSPVKYWPNGIDAGNTSGSPSNTALEKQGGKLSFFAYAPYMEKASFSVDGTGTVTTDFPTALGANTAFKTVTSPSNGIVAMTTNEFIGNVWLKYLLPKATEQEAVDLLWGLNGKTIYNEADGSDPTVGTIGSAYNINLTKQAVNEKVQFLFKHALSKVKGGSVTTTKNLDGASSNCGFSVKLDVDGNSNDGQTTYFPNGFDNTKTLVTIKSVKIQDGATAFTDPNTLLASNPGSDIYTSGWFNIERGTWDMAGATTGATININIQNDKTLDNASSNIYTLNPEIRENTANPAVKNATGTAWNSSANSSTDGYTGGASGVTVSAKALYANEYVPGLMFIPGQDQTIYVTIDYIVRTADANLATGYTEVEQVITNKVTLPAASLGANKIINIVMHLGLTSVKFEAKVADWQTNSAGSYSSDGAYTPGGDANEKSVWLPSNVVE